MIPPPIATPLAYAPLSPLGERLSLFPPVSPDAQIRPYTARSSVTPCDTLAYDMRGYKRPTRQRKRGQWFQPLRYTTQGKPTCHRKRPVYAPPHAPRPATRDPPQYGAPRLPRLRVHPAPQISDLQACPGKIRVCLAPPCAGTARKSASNLYRRKPALERSRNLREIRRAPSRRALTPPWPATWWKPTT